MKWHDPGSASNPHSQWFEYAPIKEYPLAFLTPRQISFVVSNKAANARRKFLRIFPRGFRDETYIDWERGYKREAHRKWGSNASGAHVSSLIQTERFEEIAAAAIRLESTTNLLFSFEKMALRDALRTPSAAESFSLGLYDFLHGADAMEIKFENWVKVLDELPRRQTRVLTWPLATVFGFIAQPRRHFFFKPSVTREAARRLGVELTYSTRPSWPVYKQLLNFVAEVRREISDLRPRDMIDMQSFLWVQGSDEY